MWGIRLCWLILALMWLVAENRLGRRSNKQQQTITEIETRSQRQLWIAILSGVLAGLILKNLALWPIAISYLPRQVLALLLFVAGLVLRYQAVKQLGWLFTTDVVIQNDHALMTEGPYRHLRHPAYTGLLLALLGAGLAMGDGLALLTITVPTIMALRTRIHIEERMLSDAFGQRYEAFCASRWRLIPWVY